ncbi:hypothetical protein ACFQ0T_17055 [Kitasatospora gansuensis]
MDTREGVGVAKAPLQMGSSIDLQVAGVSGVPATGVTAVTLNVTVTAPTKGSFLTVYPHGKPRPTASNLNWTPGLTIPNLVTVPVVDGKVSFYAGGEGGTVEVLADLAGYYSASGYATYNPVGPWRLMDTREDDYTEEQMTRRAGAVAAGDTLTMTTIPVRAKSVVLNVTVTQPTAAGYLTIYPAGGQRPVASSLNWSANQTIANQVVVPVNENGEISLYNGSGGNSHFVVDILGYHAY